MERRTILEVLSRLGNATRLYELYPTTAEINDYLFNNGLGTIPVLTGNSIEDLLTFTHRMRDGPERDSLWSFLKDYYNVDHCDRRVLANGLRDYLYNKHTVVSDLVGEILTDYYHVQGPHGLSYFASMIRGSYEETLRIAASLTSKGLRAALVYYPIFDRRVIASEASMAAHDPERLYWLVHNEDDWDPVDQNTLVMLELCCLALIECFELSETDAEFQSRFPDLLLAYLLATEPGNREETLSYHVTDMVWALLDQIQGSQWYLQHRIGDPVRLHYAEALALVFKACGVTMEQIIEENSDFDKVFSWLFKGGENN